MRLPFIVVVALLTTIASNGVLSQVPFFKGCAQSLSSICACELTFDGPSLSCSAVADLPALVAQLDAEAVDLHRLNIRGLTVDSIGPHAFANLTFRQLDLSNNPSLTQLDTNAFSGQSSTLEWLSLANCSLSSMPRLAGLANVRRLDASGNRLMSDVDAGTFSDMHALKELDLSECRICTLSSGALSELRTTVEYLSLAKNCLKAVPAASLRGANFLQVLDLSSNLIEKVPNMQFMNLPLLTEIRLNDNRIGVFRQMSFMNVPNLRHLNLANNRLKTVAGNLFQAFKSLQKLDLSNNEIATLGSTTFGEMPSLRQVYLDDNHIDRIETLALSNLPALDLVSIQRNRITSVYRNAFESCPMLTVLQLNDNELSAIGGGVLAGMPSLQQLHARSNNISVLEPGAFSRVPHLTTLDLGDNALVDIPAATIDALDKLFWLDVSENRLSTFTEGSLPGGLGTMLLHGNVLACTAEMDWFVRYLITNGVRTFLPAQPDILCASPEELRGTRLKDMMIRRAGQLLNETVSEAQKLDLGGLEQLLPHLLAVPGVGGGNSLGTAALNSFLRQSGVDASQLGLPAGAINRVGDGNLLLRPEFANIDGLTGPLSRFATGYKPSANDIGSLIKAVPSLVSGNQEFGLDQLSPELTRHLLRGGQIPGVPKSTLDTVIANYMRQMANAAREANEGIVSTRTARILPPVDLLPIEFIQNVANGHQLPGLSVVETRSIRDYYVRQLSTPSPLLPNQTGLITGAPNDGGWQPIAEPNDGGWQPIAEPTPAAAILPRGVIAGIGPRELLNRLPPSFDLTRLPPDMLASIANGAPFDLSRLPADMLDAFKTHNPDLVVRIDEALNRRPSLGECVARMVYAYITESTSRAPIFTRRTPSPHSNLLIPYDIQEVDRNVDVRLGNKEQEELVLLYTVIGLGVVGVLSVVILGYMCYRRRQSMNDALNTASHNDTINFVGNGAAPHAYSNQAYLQQRSNGHGVYKYRTSTSVPPAPPPSASPLQLQHQTIVQRHLPQAQHATHYEQFMSGISDGRNASAGSSHRQKSSLSNR